MNTLYFDCFSGASGDMVLGALIDAGVPLDAIREALGSLAITPDSVWTERVIRAGVAATKFQVRGEGASEGEAPRADRASGHEPMHEGHQHGHAHDHDHPHHDVPSTTAHGHRSLSDICSLIDGASLTAAGKARAKALFARMAEVEAAVHGTSPDRVHLHEVGGLDSIVDIVGTVHALEALEPVRIVASPLNVGSGMVRSAHGLYPVPAPATARLLEGVPIYAGTERAELVTPTGALLVTSYATTFGPMPAMRVRRVGYGAGTRNFAATPNVLRVFVGEDSGGTRADVVVIEAEIDDMNPQNFGPLMDRLLADGALDVYFTPIQMKKNRPGTLVTVVAAPAARERVTTTMFRESTTIGVRYREMARECLDRETVEVATPYGSVRVKVASRGTEVLNVSPEFDDCARVARDTGAPVKDVQAAAMKAFLDHRPRFAAGR